MTEENEAFDELDRRINHVLEHKKPGWKRGWVNLTDEEIHSAQGYQETREMYRFAKAVEAKLKEKNG